MKNWLTDKIDKIASLLKAGEQQVTESKEEDICLENPWQGDLDQLAEKYGEPQVRLKETKTRIKSMSGTEAAEQFASLCESVDSKNKTRKTDNDSECKKTNKQPGKTNHDMSAWWNQSVATWDPQMNAKNIDSVEQQGRKRQEKWFDKAPESHRERVD